MRLTTFLWTGVGEPPVDFVELQLCRLYRCTPSQLDGEDTARLLTHLQLVGIEAHVQKLRSKH